MANKNYGLIYSGMKSGISGAVAKGMKEIHNSSIIGIMPKNYAETKKEYIYDGCTEIVYTEDLSKRKKEMREKANAIIIVPGGVGTFDEILDAMCAKRMGLIDIPIIIYNINNYYKHFINMMEYAIETNFVKETYKDIYKVLNNIDEIFEYIENNI